MTIIRQPPSLYGIHELDETEPTHGYEVIISYIDIDAIWLVVTRKSRLDAPEELNYVVTIISIFISYVKRLSIIKDLRKCLKEGVAFKLICGFLVSDNVPSEVCYARLLTELRIEVSQDPQTRSKEELGR